jgi:PmbA protein
MERDYDFSSRQHYADLDAPEAIGRRAGERAVRRLGARKAKTGPVDVVFDPRVARGIASHLAGAINGASVARKTSFLRDMMGKKVAASAITVTDDPLRRRGQASRPFDGEGVEGRRLLMVENGILNHWFLSTSAARELGLATNGRGARSGSSVSPSSTNLAIEPGEKTPQELIGALKTGFYVTEVFGQGVNMVTGEYSRGASGFWIENGELTYPVSEVTIASNLKTMFLNMVAASDLDRDFGTAAPTLLIEGMTLAGS